MSQTQISQNLVGPWLIFNYLIVPKCFNMPLPYLMKTFKMISQLKWLLSMDSFLRGLYLRWVSLGYPIFQWPPGVSRGGMFWIGSRNISQLLHHFLCDACIGQDSPTLLTPSWGHYTDIPRQRRISIPKWYASTAQLKTKDHPDANFTITEESRSCHRATRNDEVDIITLGFQRISVWGHHVFPPVSLKISISCWEIFLEAKVTFHPCF